MLVFKSPFVYLIMAAKHKDSDAGNSDLPKRCRSTSLKEKGIYV